MLRAKDLRFVAIYTLSELLTELVLNFLSTLYFCPKMLLSESSTRTIYLRNVRCVELHRMRGNVGVPGTVRVKSPGEIVGLWGPSQTV